VSAKSFSVVHATIVVLVIVLTLACPIVDPCVICIILSTSIAVNPSPPLTPVVAEAVIFTLPEVAEGVKVVAVVFRGNIGPANS
jgi:hypothetical protein